MSFLFRTQENVRLDLFSAIAFGALFLSAQVWANPLAEARIGVLDHSSRLISSGIEDGADLNLELLFKPSIIPFHILFSPYVNFGASFNNDGHNTDQIYTGLVWEIPLIERLFGRFGGGLALHDGVLEGEHENQRTLGQRVLLRASFELGRCFGRHHAFALVFDHISNGPLSGPNQGINNLGVRYSYRF